MQRWPDLMITRADTGLGGQLRKRLRRPARPTTDASRPLALALAAAAGPGGVRLSASDEKSISAAGRHDWIEADRVDLIALLESGVRGKIAFDWLDTLGWVAANMPEISHTIGAPQLAPFHDHPVDSHLWRTVDEMRLMIDGKGDWYAAIAGEVDDRRLLLLAAFVHDIGKALPGDHSEVGGDIAEALLTRIGFDGLAVPVSRLVRLHLLLAATATKRDTSDRRVLEAVAAECGELRLLQALYLLSVADARATGRTMWTDWKATLLKNLYVRVAAMLEPDAMGASRQERIAAVAAIGQTAPDSISAHVVAMPPEYLSGHSDDEIAAHYELAARPGGAAAAVAFLDAEGAARRVAVTAADRPGLLVAIAGVFAINNLEVLDARLETRRDGVACDTFHVRQLLPKLPPASAAEIEVGLRAALGGELDVDSLVAEKIAPYRRAPGKHLVVRTPVDPTLRFTAIEVRCDDRPGVLYEIVREIHDAGLDIRMARIDTRGDEVRDLFYVLRGGAPIRDVNEVEPVISHLRSAVAGPLEHHARRTALIVVTDPPLPAALTRPLAFGPAWQVAVTVPATGPVPLTESVNSPVPVTSLPSTDSVMPSVDSQLKLGFPPLEMSAYCTRGPKESSLTYTWAPSLTLETFHSEPAWPGVAPMYAQSARSNSQVSSPIVRTIPAGPDEGLGAAVVLLLAVVPAVVPAVVGVGSSAVESAVSLPPHAAKTTETTMRSFFTSDLQVARAINRSNLLGWDRCCRRVNSPRALSQVKLGCGRAMLQTLDGDSRIASWQSGAAASGVQSGGTFMWYPTKSLVPPVRSS